MRITSFLIVSMLLCLALKSDAQATNIVKLEIGDTVPSVLINNIINYSKESANLTDFRGRLLIIDFWATWCVPCVSAFLKQDSLQKKFAENIQILSVTSEDKDKVANFLSKMRRVNKLLPPSVTNDSILTQLFPHSILPHYVWIDKTGKVIAETEGKELTEENIQLVLNDKPTSFQVKRDNMFSVSYSPYLFIPSYMVNYNNKDSSGMVKMDIKSTLMQSTLTTYVDGFDGGGIRSEPITARNVTISMLYTFAFKKNPTTAPIVEISDSILFRHVTARNLNGSRFFNPGLEALAWMKDNTYCYELKVPESLKDKKYDIMLMDLNRYFGQTLGIEGILETRTTKCLSLVRTSLIDKLATKGGKELIQTDSYSLKIENWNLNTAVLALTLPLQSYPMLLNETSYEGKVDLELNCDLSNLNSVNRELSKYDLKFVEKDKLMEVVVIRMKK